MKTKTERCKGVVHVIVKVWEVNGFVACFKLGFVQLICKASSFFKSNLELKLKVYFSYKDPIPDDLKSFLVYKFTCTSCSSS